MTNRVSQASATVAKLLHWLLLSSYLYMLAHGHSHLRVTYITSFDLRRTMFVDKSTSSACLVCTLTSDQNTDRIVIIKTLI